MEDKGKDYGKDEVESEAEKVSNGNQDVTRD